jgi:hypothetical protein
LTTDSDNSKIVFPLAEIIGRRLREFPNEKEFTDFIFKFFKNEYFFAKVKHGSVEHGLDLLVCIPRDYDVLGKGLFYLFQIKINDITAKVWKEGLHSQLMSLVYHPVDEGDFNPLRNARRIILITNCEINEHVLTEIKNFNSKSVLPIEYLDGSDLAHLMAKKLGTIEDFQSFLHKPD